MSQTPAKLHQDDDCTLDYTPGSDVIAGQVVLIGSVPAIAPRAISSGVKGAVKVGGVWAVPKTSDAFTAGDAVYWDADGDPVTGTAGTGAADSSAATGNLMGYAAYDAAAEDDYVYVVLTAAKRTATIAGSVSADDITGSDSTLTITGLAGAGGSAGGTVPIAGGEGHTNGAGGASGITGGAGAGTGAGGAVNLTGGASGTGATGNGGAATVVGGAALSTNGTGGAVSATGGVGKGSGAGGAASLVGGAGGAAGTGAGGAVTITGGASGTGATGNGGAVTIAGGAASSTNGNGGTVTISAGALAGTGAPGKVKVGAGNLHFTNAQTLDMADAQVALTLVPGTPVGTLVTSNVLAVDANSGTTEDLLLPPEADSNGLVLFIQNTGGEDIVVKEDSDTTTVCTISTAECGIVSCDGTTWRGGVIKTT